MDLLILLVFISIFALGIFLLYLHRRNSDSKIFNKLTIYNCFDIAKFFVKEAKNEGQGIDPMKLLKLTYIAHGWYLAVSDKPLFHNQVQAWKYGAVIPDLYYTIRIFGKDNVDPYLLNISSKNELKEVDENFLKKIWNNYKNLSGLQLSALTHEEGSPWRKTWDGTHNAVIENSVIKDYYKNKLVKETVNG